MGGHCDGDDEDEDHNEVGDKDEDEDEDGGAKKMMRCEGYEDDDRW